MTEIELKQVFKDWGLSAAQAAKVLCLHTSKLSEYLDGISRIPCAVAFHIEALRLLTEEQRQNLFERRLQHKVHSAN